ncbi:hypothetical protein KHP62_17445 [Rhodobacteraceae bacterium NNCM2]|nr:hypothetical protein [Coraliihabitans acroporae]
MRRAAILLTCLALPAAADDRIAPGLYRVSTRVEIPHVDTSDYDFSRDICLRDGDFSALGPLGPGPMGQCPRRVTDQGDQLEVSVVCPGGNTGFALAQYWPAPGGFRGVVNLNMGGKNMTLVERQRGRRIGECAD